MLIEAKTHKEKKNRKNTRKYILTLPYTSLYIYDHMYMKKCNFTLKLEMSKEFTTYTSKVLKCGAGEGWRSVGLIM